ncbi:MAG: hypothetical protein JRH20_12665 [Deltaproteobacteria bacterium]|nr:hypothetical protein [Deltaproteobacteria bacterium]
MERAGTTLLRFALAAALLAGLVIYFGLAASGVAEWQVALRWYFQHQWSQNPLFLPSAALAGVATLAWLVLAVGGLLSHQRRLASGSVPARRVEVISDEELRCHVQAQLDPELRKTQPRIERVVDVLLGLPVDIGASEVILVPGAQNIELSLRLGMNRVVVGKLSPEVYRGVLERLQLIVGIEEPTGHGVIELRAGVSVEMLEVHISRGEGGREVSLLLTRRAGYSRTLAELGLPNKVTQRLDEALSTGRGLVVVAGEAAQGLCTTLYAMAHHLHQSQQGSCDIAGVEPHVRLELPFMVQMEVGAARPEAILEGLLQEDHKAIVVRRVEDAATAKLIVQAAKERLMIVSLEAAGPVDAVARLARWVSAQELRSVTHFVLGQRLLPHLCSCREEVGIAQEEQRDLEQFASLGAATYYAPAGCARCQGKGYVEQQRALFWAFDFRGGLGDALDGEVSEAALQRAARRHRLGPIGPALELARSGEVALVDVVRLLDGRW